MSEVDDFPTVTTLSQKENTMSVERYFPEGYPKYLVHGTSLKMGETYLRDGMRNGILTTDCIESLSDPRFYTRKVEGCFVVCSYNRNNFVTKNEADDIVEPFQHYMIRSGTGEPAKIDAERYDTDGISLGVKTLFTDKLLKAEQISVAQIEEDDIQYLTQVIHVIKGSYSYLKNIDKDNIEKMLAVAQKYNVDETSLDGQTDLTVNHGISGETIIDYDTYQRQLFAADLFEVDVANFTSKNLLQKAMTEKFGNEETFFKFIMQKLGTQINWIDKKLELNDNDLLSDLLVESYQTSVVSKILNISNDSDTDHWVMFPEGQSAKGLMELVKEKGLDIKLDEPDVVLEKQPAEEIMNSAVAKEPDKDFILD